MQQQQYNNISYNIMQQPADVSIHQPESIFLTIDQSVYLSYWPIRGMYANFRLITGTRAAQAKDQNPGAAKVKQPEVQISVRGQGRRGSTR